MMETTWSIWALGAEVGEPCKLQHLNSSSGLWSQGHLTSTGHHALLSCSHQTRQRHARHHEARIRAAAGSRWQQWPARRMRQGDSRFQATTLIMDQRGRRRIRRRREGGENQLCSAASLSLSPAVPAEELEDHGIICQLKCISLLLSARCNTAGLQGPLPCAASRHGFAESCNHWQLSEANEGGQAGGDASEVRAAAAAAAAAEKSRGKDEEEKEEEESREAATLLEPLKRSLLSATWTALPLTALSLLLACLAACLLFPGSSFANQLTLAASDPQLAAAAAAGGAAATPLPAPLPPSLPAVPPATFASVLKVVKEQGLLLTVLLALSAFFSMAETSITTLWPWKVREMAEKESEGSVFQLLRKDVTRFLTTILIGTTLVNIWATALVTEAATALFGEAGVSAATGVMTVLLLLFTEIAPKSIAVHNAAQVIRIIVQPVAWLSVVLYPVGRVCTAISMALLRLLGLQTKGEPFVTEEELKLMLRGAEMSGAIEEDEQDMIENVLEIKETAVREVMTPLVDVVAIDAAASVMDFRSLWVKHQYSRVPVYERRVDNIVGIAYAMDMLDYVEQPELLSRLRVGRICHRPAYFVPDSMSVWNLLREFRIRKVHMAIVLNEYGGTVGLATLEDVVEEIVGEIFDENDSTEEIRKKTGYVVERAEGVFDVDANTSVEDLMDALQVKIPVSPLYYETVSGFVCEAFGYIPRTGDRKVIRLMRKEEEEEEGKEGAEEDEKKKEEVKRSQKSYLRFRIEILTGNARKVGAVRFERMSEEGDGLENGMSGQRDEGKESEEEQEIERQRERDRERALVAEWEREKEREERRRERLKESSEGGPMMASEEEQDPFTGEKWLVFRGRAHDGLGRWSDEDDDESGEERYVPTLVAESVNVDSIDDVDLPGGDESGRRREGGLFQRMEGLEDDDVRSMGMEMSRGESSTSLSTPECTVLQGPCVDPWAEKERQIERRRQRRRKERVEASAELERQAASSSRGGYMVRDARTLKPDTNDKPN